MDKLKLNFKEREWRKIDFNGQDVMVKPYINNLDQLTLIGIYLEQLFDESEDSRFAHARAENAFLAALVEMQTNIELVEEGNILVTMDNLFEHWNLVELIEKGISNYSNVKMRLLRAVEHQRELQKLDASLGKSLLLIYAKLQNFVEELIDMDWDDEKLAKIKEALKEINESPVLKESIKIFKNQETPKSE